MRTSNSFEEQERTYTLLYSMTLKMSLDCIHQKTFANNLNFNTYYKCLTRILNAFKTN